MCVCVCVCADFIRLVPTSLTETHTHTHIFPSMKSQSAVTGVKQRACEVVSSASYSCKLFLVFLIDSTPSLIMRIET